MQKPCKYCDNGQVVNMEENAPGSKYKWSVTNLDGTFHKHVKYSSQPAETPQQTIVNMPTNPTHEYEAKITAGLRSEAIAKAHEENMEANDKLRAAINSLNDQISDVGSQLYNITRQLSSFNDIVRAYLETLNKE